MTAAPSYLIVGAGIFGVSTAYHLLKQHPRASITLVDRDAHDAERRVAASWDWNKVMRADYDDPTYCALALEAQDVFTGVDDDDEGLWRPHFHQTGLYWMCGREYAQRCVDNVRRLGRAADADAMAMCTVDEARALFGGLFRDADYTHVDTVLVNRSGGWVAAGECLGAVTRHVVRRGVRYVAEEVATLLFGDDGDRARCVGVETAAGTRCLADHVILCTGAFTPKLLELSAAARHDDPGLAARLVAGDRILAGGITTGMTRLAGHAAVARFANMPVGIQGYTAAKGE